MNKRSVGSRYEQKACAYLTDNGYQILERNFRCPLGEIDLIAEDENYLVFIEVKYRSSDVDGCGLEAVDYRKQKRILKTAGWYLMKMGLSDETPCRFDVLSYNRETAVLIKNAFES